SGAMASVRQSRKWKDDQMAASLALSPEEEALIISRLHNVLRPFLLRRAKHDVQLDLPSKEEVVLLCPLSAHQAAAYESILAGGRDAIDAVTGRITGSFSSANFVMRLRQICNHPYLLADEWVVDANLVRSSGKFDALHRLLPALLAAGHRVLLFSQMTTLLDLIEDLLGMLSIEFVRLDGRVAAGERHGIISSFNDPSSPVRVFLLSTRAGGVGLNLQSADTVILFDSDWNPQQDLQAQARAHRLGQERRVQVIRFVSQGPPIASASSTTGWRRKPGVEEIMFLRGLQKLHTEATVIGGGGFHYEGGHAGGGGLMAAGGGNLATRQRAAAETHRRKQALHHVAKAILTAGDEGSPYTGLPIVHKQLAATVAHLYDVARIASPALRAAEECADNPYAAVPLSTLVAQCARDEADQLAMLKWHVALQHVAHVVHSYGVHGTWEVDVDAGTEARVVLPCDEWEYFLPFSTSRMLLPSTLTNEQREASERALQALPLALTAPVAYADAVHVPDENSVSSSLHHALLNTQACEAGVSAGQRRVRLMQPSELSRTLQNLIFMPGHVTTSAVLPPPPPPPPSASHAAGGRIAPQPMTELYGSGASAGVFHSSMQF
ncbi:MAG: hypothetical protein EOO41_00550, partial [Methanobacteriota archaeon]